MDRFFASEIQARIDNKTKPLVLLVCSKSGARTGFNSKPR